uniref:Uncharacterized protein n=1 Tax=Xanthomonas phage MK21 TaxID=3148942 RepID=A0AAU7J8I1_9CAUD
MSRISFHKQTTLRDWFMPLLLREVGVLYIGPFRIKYSKK